MTVAERLEILEEQEQALESLLSGPSRGTNLPQAAKDLAAVRRKIAMLTEDKRRPMPTPEPQRRPFR